MARQAERHAVRRAEALRRAIRHIAAANDDVASAGGIPTTLRCYPAGYHSDLYRYSDECSIHNPEALTPMDDDVEIARQCSERKRQRTLRQQTQRSIDVRNRRQTRRLVNITDCVDDNCNCETYIGENKTVFMFNDETTQQAQRDFVALREELRGRWRENREQVQ